MAVINYNTKVQFDFGALSTLAGELEAVGARRPLVVTDAGVVAAGLLDRVLEALPAGIEPAIFDAMPANPTEVAATAAHAAYLAGACDSVIGLGGGSAMDGAKAAAILASNDGPLERYAYYNVGMNFPPRLPVPTFVVPTTAGTGSEVARSAVLIFESGRKSLLFVTPGTVRCAILDPELTLTLPPAITAATGMDAMAHCLETFCSPRVNPPADAIALDGMRRAAGHLERAVADGTDRAARWNMMMAAMEGALAFQKGMGAVHALSHPLGALQLHHGTLNAVLIPSVLRYNADHLQEKFRTLRDTLGLSGHADIADWFAALNVRIGMPSGLGEMGVPRDRLDEISEEAMADSSHPSNPRPMTAQDYRAVLEAAF